MKLLLITYYFPPCGGASVQRWLRLVNALHKRGIQVTVITTQDGDYPVRDDSLMAKLPKGLRILRSKPLGFSRLWQYLGQSELPYGSLKSRTSDSFLKKALYWLRLNLIIPDMRIGWNPGAYRTTKAELLKDKYDAVITTGPPHSTHLIGIKLKQRFNIRWYTDFRDPMSDIYYLKLNPPNRITMMLHRYLERKIIQTADMNYIVSRSIADALPQGNKTVLYNGFDPMDFDGLEYSRAVRFRIKYVGQLTAGQDITPVLDAIGLLNNRCTIEFSFIGTSNVPDTDQPVRHLPFLPHHEALKELVNAELLVMVINNYEGNKGMLTTKLFEYIASRSPILCLSTAGGEAVEIILRSQSGVVISSQPGISNHILSLYHQWHNGNDLRCTGDISPWDVNRQVESLLS